MDKDNFQMTRAAIIELDVTATCTIEVEPSGTMRVIRPALISIRDPRFRPRPLSIGQKLEIICQLMRCDWPDDPCHVSVELEMGVIVALELDSKPVELPVIRPVFGAASV